MAAFMYHCSYILHLPRCIHENKRSAAFRQRTIITSGSLAIPAFKVKVLHYIHLLQARTKKRMKVLKTFNRFIEKLTSRFKGGKRFCPFRLGFHIPGPKFIKLQ